MTSAAVDSTTVVNGLLEAARQFREIAALDWTTGVDARVIAWTCRVSDLLQRASSADLEALGPDHCRLDNLQMRYTAMARSLLRAPSLGHEARATLTTFIAARPRYIHSKYKLTYDCFSARAPQMQRDLERFVGRPNLHFLEVGSFEGHSACWLLENVLTHQTSRLMCVDLFPPGSRQRFEFNIRMSGAAPRVKAICGWSRDILPRLVPRKFDFIYIDGSHNAVDVLEDAVLAWRLLPVAGLMTFDDYLLKDVPVTQILHPQRPDVGIDAFLTTYHGRYDVVSRGFQVTIEKRAVA